MSTDPLKIAIKGSTQDHLPIEDVVEKIVMLKDGSCAIVLQLSSVNFDLLSEKEQSALIFAYGGVLNSLNFPIQIIIHSSTKDVSNYLNNLKEAELKQDNELLRERIKSYRKFIEETIKRNEVLSKSFYVAIPFSLLEMGIQGAGSQLGSFFPNKSQRLPFSKDYIIEKAQANLEPKRDHLIRLFSRLGLEIRQLETKELIQLFYKIYNQETAATEKVQTLNYTAPNVTANLNNQ